MASNYPSVLDNTTDLIDNATDATVTATVHAAAHNNAADAIIAIETALGVNPFGSFSTVAAWLAATIISGSTTQTIQPSSDVIGVIFKQHSNISTSEITVWENYAGTIKAFIDDNFIFSAQGISVNGSPISSSNLSDSANIAHLASPAFTGTPTAPTAPSSTNNTQLATTAFVETAVGLIQGVPTGVILSFAGSVAPTGYLLTDGSSYSTTTYSNLFSAIGYTYGGSGGNFNVPDLRGRMVAGYAVSGGHSDVSTLGNNEGVAEVHRRPTHNTSISVTDPGHVHGAGDGNQFLTDGSGSGLGLADSNPITSVTDTTSNTTSITVTGGPGGTGSEDTPAYIVLNHIIKI